MDYQKIHDKIIETRLSFSPERTKIWENRKKLRGTAKSSFVLYMRHHIIPKCLGGTDIESNIILLTAKEHYLIHWLLSKIYPNTGLISAQFRLAHDRTGKYVTGRKYELLMKNFSIYQSKSVSGRKATAEAKRNMSIAQSGINHPMYGKRHTVSAKLKMSRSRSGANHHLYGKHHLNGTKQKMSSSHMGKKLSDATKLKMSKVRTGKKASEETKKKMSLSASGKNNNFYGKKHSKESKQKMGHVGIDNANYGKKYWKSGSIKNNINMINRWLFLDILYEIWISNQKCGAKMLKNKSIHITIIDLKCTYNKIIDYFKNVGNPLLDNEWLTFKRKHG